MIGKSRKLSRREAIVLLGAGVAGACGARTSPASPTAVTMQTRPIPSTKEAIPIIGLGTWQTFDVARAESVRDVLTEFVKLGGRVVDSSPMYGRSEEVLGELRTNELFIATKVWTTGRAAGIAQMEASERKLRGKVDLMQVHNLVDVDTHLATLRDWKKSGRIRYLGISHYTSSAYASLERELAKGGIDFVQLNYSLAEPDAERRLLPLAADLGVAVLVNRPLGGGSLFRTVRSKPLPPFAADLGCTSWAELFLKFVVSHPAVTCAIPATSKVEHLRENMRAGGGVMPDAATRAKIAAAAG